MCVLEATCQSQPVISRGLCWGSYPFNFHTNDISLLQLTADTISLYEYDVMLYHIIRSQVDFVALQIDVDASCVWTDDERQCYKMHVNGNLKKATIHHTISANSN